MRKILIAGSALFFILFFCSHVFAADLEEQDFSYNLRSMIQMNPDFTTYPGSDGVIWLKRIDYSSAPDGGVERKSQWILLGRTGLDPRWLLWNIPLPQNGDAEILEASVYSSSNGEKLHDAVIVDSVAGSLEMRTATFSDLPEEFILVVTYRELSPDRLSLEDLIWVSESLPVWEGLIQLTVPTGHPFYYSSNLESGPSAQKLDERMFYEWQVINTLPDVRRSLRKDSRGYIAFAVREGKETAARFLKNLEGTPTPLFPGSIAKTRGKLPNAKEIENFLRRVFEEPELLLPAGAVREIPEAAPWTKREKLLIAHRALENAGVDVRLFWQMAYRPETNEPACESMIVAPVLEIGVPAKKDAYYYDMEKAPRGTETSLGLQGQTVYGVTQNGRIEELKIPVVGASENRLSSLFRLKLSEDGILSGTIRITARNAWEHFLLPENPSRSDLESFIAEIFPQIPRYSDISVKKSRNESEILLTLSGTQAIKGTDGRSILLTIPSLLPVWLKDLSSSFPYTLRFPFVMNAQLTLELPASTENVMLPTPMGQTSGKIRYSESYKLIRKKTLTAEAQMTVGTSTILEGNAADFGIALRNWQAFMEKNLPVKLRAGKK